MDLINIFRHISAFFGIFQQKSTFYLKSMNLINAFRDILVYFGIFRQRSAYFNLKSMDLINIFGIFWHISAKIEVLFEINRLDENFFGIFRRISAQFGIVRHSSAKTGIFYLKSMDWINTFLAYFGIFR